MKWPEKTKKIFVFLEPVYLFIQWKSFLPNNQENSVINT